jgi:hypothetical protein
MDAQMVKAVEMTRSIRERHSERLMGLSHKELIAFYQKQARKVETMVPVLLKEKNAILMSVSSESFRQDR